MADVPDAVPIPSLLRAPLRALLRGENAEWPVDATAADAAQLIESIEQNGLASLVYARVSDWPIRASLRDRAIHAAAGETARIADLRTLLAAFDANGIQVLIIKGTALAYDIYPSPEL